MKEKANVTNAPSSNVRANEEPDVAILEGLEVCLALIGLAVTMQTHAGVGVASVVCPTA